MTEVWRVISEFPDYGISDCGRVKRLTGGQGARPGRILAKNRKSEDGYRTAVLRDPYGLPHTLQVHRLVALSFVRNPKNKPEVNHKDGVKDNNKPSNLEWVTHVEQMKHAVQMNLIALGSASSRAKLHERNIPVIRTLRSGGRTFQSIADRFRVTPQTIMSVIYKETWKHVA